MTPGTRFRHVAGSTYEVSHLDETEGEWYPVELVFLPELSASEALLEAVEAYLGGHLLAGEAWEVRSANGHLAAWGRFDGGE